MTTFLIIGASRGIGHGLAEGLPRAGDTTFLVSRSLEEGDVTQDGVRRVRLRADVTAADTPARIAAMLGDGALDVCIYNAGVWERGWTSSDYEAMDESEIRTILDTNLTGLILCVRAVLPHLRRSKSAKLMLIGSISGMDNESSSPVTYAASKFGVRGAAHALRPLCRASGIAVTCINPGAVANDVPYEDGIEAALKAHGGRAIPVGDLVQLARAVLAMSPATCVKEINVPALLDEGV